MKTRAGAGYRILPFLLVLIGFALYIGALRAPFVYDDRAYILMNPDIRSLSNFLNLSGTRYVGFLTFALNFSISGYNAFDFHLVNVLVHVCNSILVFYLVSITFETPVLKGFASGRASIERGALSMAFAASAVFLVHPIQTQTVTYITQRFASLATMFYLLSVLFYIKARLAGQSCPDEPPGSTRRLGRGAWPFYIASVIAAVMAMKSKEISFTLPFMIVIYDYLFFGRKDAGRVSLLRIPFYLTLVIIPLSVMGLGLFGGDGGRTAETLRKLQLEEAVGLDRYVYTLTQFRVIITYIRLLFLPIGQQIDYDYRTSQTMLDPATLISFIALIALFVFSLFVLARSYSGRNHYGLLFSFGMLWFFVALSVESFLVPIQDVIFEQRVYLPSVGFIISVFSALFFLVDTVRRRTSFKPSNAAAAAVMLLLLLPPLSYATHLRNIVWGDELRLLNEAIGKSSTKGRLYYIRSMVYIDRGMYDDAIVDATTAITLQSDIHEAYNMRGFAYMNKGMYKDALADLNTAIAVEPDEGVYYYNRGLAYSGLKMVDEAIADYTRSIRLRPDYAAAYNNRGVTYSAIGEIEKAGRDLQAACSKGYRQGCDNLKIFEKGVWEERSNASASFQLLR